MKQFFTSPDKLAISFSTLCVFHCLALPFLVVLLPSMASSPLNQEAFHLWMVVAVIPTSLYALTLGCKKHEKLAFFAYGLAGLSALVVALLFGESLLGEAGEKTLTTLGAIIIAYAHLKNYQLCQRHEQCG